MDFKKILSIILIIIAVLSCDIDEIVLPENILNYFPFPNHTNYAGVHIKPNNYSQTELDDQTRVFFDNWKTAYLKNDCNANEYYIYSGSGAKTISEAHGYGMMIMCFMAGYDKNAKTYFNGLFNYYKSHPSNINNNLMDWQQLSCNDSISADDDAASDGDIDIAFSLLLAHKQWGSEGEIKYLSEAKTIINAIMQDEINSESWTVKLGDWSNSSDPKFYYGTRSSDFITSHFRVFSIASNNPNWDLVVDKCFDLINNTQNPKTGLLPDFIINTNSSPIPAGPNYLEGIYDGDFYYNACRFPWRIGTDYLINGDNRAKRAVNKVNTWLISSTGKNVKKISNGYLLNGTPINDWNNATFLGPFTVGAMVDLTNQNWLNNLYDELVNNNDIMDGIYYSNTIKLLSMITISGNYWNP